MQLKKMVNQTLENDEIINFEHKFSLFGPNLDLQSSFWGFYLQALSQAIIVSNFKENVWSKLNKTAKNLILGLI